MKCGTILLAVVLAAGVVWGQESGPEVLAPGAQVRELAKEFQFTEGPVADARGDVYFSDIPAARMYKWSPEKGILLVRENTGGTNGLAFDAAGKILGCQTLTGRVMAFDPNGSVAEVTVVAATYEGKRFNQTNDLWVAPNGRVYFTDPVYGRVERSQDGEHVYCVSADRKKVMRVIDDMVRPNGLIGTPDGGTLYVADLGGKKTYRYRVNEDGTLRDKMLFASMGSDGMTIDAAGNVYMTTDAVYVFTPGGKQIARIEIPQRPTNVCFAGKNGKTLFITAHSGVYAVESAIGGVRGTPPKQQSR